MDAGLHSLIGDRVAGVAGAFYLLVGGAKVTIVGFSMLTKLEEASM